MTLDRAFALLRDSALVSFVVYFIGRGVGAF
jgi:hypothetical protein